MKLVGFLGGGLISALGTPQEMAGFYRCMHAYGCDLGGVDLSILTDRLYRRYLRAEELDPAVAAMSSVKLNFANINCSTALKDFGFHCPSVPHNSNLDPTLDLSYYRYFQSFEKCVSMARDSVAPGRKYAPVMTGVTAIPESINDYKNRPLVEFDNLEGPPFWLE